jgi:serine/threonine protein kinase
MPNPKGIEELNGKLTDHYAVLSVLQDRGDFCQVKRVKSREDEAEYVMKIQGKKAMGRKAEQRFRDTTVQMMNLEKHQHIVQIHRCLEDSNYFYTLEEACDGGNLLEFLKHLKAKGLEAEALEDQVRRVIGELLISLRHLHKNGLVHKDVKLENAVLKKKVSSLLSSSSSFHSTSTKASTTQDAESDSSTQSECKLIDFDFVAPVSSVCKDVLGTDGYIAPEAYLGYVCPKSDIFSAGVVMFALIAGSMPFDDAIFDDCLNQNCVGHPKMQEIHDKLRRALPVSFGKSWKYMYQAQDFCGALLEFDVAKRPTAEEALRHPWMEKLLKKYVKLAEITTRNRNKKKTPQRRGTCV